MPEGPEVRREADQIADRIQGQRLTEVVLALPALAPRAAGLRGRRATRVRSRGKAMLVEFDNGLVLYSHNQLYGKWLTVAAGARPPPTNRSLRVALQTSAGSALLYSASDVALLRADELDQHSIDHFDRHVADSGWLC